MRPSPLTVLHTSDWHLGHTLHGHARAAEHDAFLAFLLDVLAREAVDALIVAGDVFDTSNPPAAAQAAYYRFLAEARRRRPGLDIVVVAGNHDSAARLTAPRPVLSSLGVRVVGAVPRRGPTGRAPIDPEPMIVPLHAADGEVGAWVAAVPFLRLSDLDRAPDRPGVDGPAGSATIDGVRRLYGQVLDAARARREPGQALLATGHLHLADTRPSEESERPVIGAQHALPVDVFPDDVAYVALGHLHLAQAVGGREEVRYSGSPIPLSMAEATYPHQVRLVRLEGERVAAQQAVRVPRAVDVLRVPADGPGELPHVLKALRRLPDALRREDGREAPFLDVRVRLPGPMPDLRAQVEEALGDAPVRLVRIAIERPATGEGLAEGAERRRLSDLTVEEVFRRCYARRYDGEPDARLLAAFREVVEAAYAGPEPEVDVPARGSDGAEGGPAATARRLGPSEEATR